MKLPSWLTRGVAIAIGIALLVIILFGVMSVRSCQSASTAKTEGKLANGQATGAFQSANDALTTASNSTATAGQIHAEVKDAQDAIENAPAGARNAAAERATCKLRSYRSSKRCIALLGPVAP